MNIEEIGMGLGISILLISTVIPGVFALLGGILAFKQIHKHQEQKQRKELQLLAFSQYVPLRLAAHERSLLFLERIQFEQLVMRNQPEQHSANNFHILLKQDILAEFEHNIVQQLYIHEDTWRLIVASKNEVLSTIEASFSSLNNDKANGIQLTQAIVKRLKDSGEEMLYTKAISALKSDITQYFG